jgi:hypothetical protein
MKKIYLSGTFVNEEHVKRAWARIRAGVRIEFAAASVLPASKRINSATRGAYQASLVGILALKRQLFTRACEEAKKGEDWRRVFRGRKSVFWPDIQERAELGLIDYTRHELILTEPYKGRPIKVRMTIDHRNRSVREVAVVLLNGHDR